jgi:hypothetical protein
VLWSFCAGIIWAFCAVVLCWCNGVMHSSCAVTLAGGVVCWTNVTRPCCCSGSGALYSPLCFRAGPQSLLQLCALGAPDPRWQQVSHDSPGEWPVACHGAAVRNCPNIYPRRLLVRRRLLDTRGWMNLAVLVHVGCVLNALLYYSCACCILVHVGCMPALVMFWCMFLSHPCVSLLTCSSLPAPPSTVRSVL